MEQKFMDECFRARMEYTRDRFPLEEFRKRFLEDYTHYGKVTIQGEILSMPNVGGLVNNREYGFAFSNQHSLDFALRLIRRWGFDVIHVRKRKAIREYTAYIVQLPQEYIVRHLGSERAGIIRTGLRSIKDIDMTKRQNPYD